MTRAGDLEERHQFKTVVCNPTQRRLRLQNAGRIICHSMQSTVPRIVWTTRIFWGHLSACICTPIFCHTHSPQIAKQACMLSCKNKCRSQELQKHISAFALLIAWIRSLSQYIHTAGSFARSPVGTADSRQYWVASLSSFGTAMRGTESKTPPCRPPDGDWAIGVSPGIACPARRG